MLSIITPVTQQSAVLPGDTGLLAACKRLALARNPQAAPMLRSQAGASLSNGGKPPATSPRPSGGGDNPNRLIEACKRLSLAKYGTYKT